MKYMHGQNRLLRWGTSRLLAAGMFVSYSLALSALISSYAIGRGRDIFIRIPWLSSRQMPNLKIQSFDIPISCNMHKTPGHQSYYTSNSTLRNSDRIHAKRREYDLSPRKQKYIFCSRNTNYFANQCRTLREVRRNAYPRDGRR